ncbi:hypothetical protein [Paenibacillus sp.]|uniref:hypothetical protein n=1 Tax=Paenibacillus sp. TaxID=58172 RepID=UPI002D634018|nr:hypothetical protein [Paenibacillus sp.]HZG58321.1 hypothetical protein [Paenibacillus sp.]
MWMIVTLLGIVVLLYASMLPRPPERKPVTDDFLDSVGDTLQHFADEIEQENKELLRMVGEMKREHEQRTLKLLSRIESLEKQSVSAAGAGIVSPSAPEPERSRGAATKSVTSAEAEPIAEASLPAAAVERKPAARSAAATADSPVVETPVVTPAAVTPAGKPPHPADEPGHEPIASPPSRFANTVKARYKDVFDLYDGGKSIEFIAKKLGKNKGEVQLIIGLAKQEEPHHGQP